MHCNELTTLVELCREVIKYLTILKEKNLISEAEYQKHTGIKLMFIKEIGN